MTPLNAPRQLERAPWRSEDPGNGNGISVDKQLLFVPLTIGSGSETRTIQHPTKSGLLVTLCAIVNGGGSIALTDADGSSAFDVTGDATITFNNVGDFVTLISIPASTTTHRWQILQSYGATGITSNLTGAASVTTLVASSYGTFVSYVTVAGATSGGIKILPAATSGYLVNITNATQTVGATTLTIPNFASVADTFVFTTLAQTLANKTLTAPVISTGLTASGSTANDFSGSTGTFSTSTGAGTYAGRATFSKSILRACQSAVTALGSAAGVITADKDVVLLLSVTTATTYGWTLPTGVAGMVLTLVNTAAYANTLIPAVGGTINGLSANAGVVIAASKCYIAVCSAADTWHVMEAAKATAA